jgi:hypothetical protein
VDAERSLGAVAQRFVVGAARVEDLHQAFLAAVVFCPAGERPGFVALGDPPAGVVPMFSSEGELVRLAGAVAWFSATGRDVLALLPSGYDVLLDPGGESPLRLRPAALRTQPAMIIGWR